MRNIFVIILIFFSSLKHLPANEFSIDISGSLNYQGEEYKALFFIPAFNLNYRHHTIKAGFIFHVLNLGHFVLKPDNFLQRTGISMGYSFYVRDPEKKWTFGPGYNFYLIKTKISRIYPINRIPETVTLMTHNLGISFLYNINRDISLSGSLGIYDPSYQYWANNDITMFYETIFELGVKYRLNTN